VRRLHTLVFFLFAISTTCGRQAPTESITKIDFEEPVNGIRIAWDYTTLKQLSPIHANYSGYARMIKLHDGRLFCVYESDGATQAISSRDGGKQWSEPMILAIPENNVSRAVPEVLQLHDQSILVSYNLRPRGNNADPAKRFAIQVIRSTDGGEHWSDPVEVYKAGFEFKNGCWEPAQIQLPSGEIQLYIANEAPYTQSDEQEITMFRSADHGATWSVGETISFRSGHRDGMPVPLLLRNNKEIILVIEDNGIEQEEFKPVIIRTAVANSWSNAPVLASGALREYAMDKSERIPGTKYGGAPYIRQLPSGEVILSYQGNERRKDFQWDRSDMIVAIGSTEGKNFNRKSTPFYISDPSKTGLWNSLCVENDSTVIALSSTDAYGKTAVWMIKGYILPEIKSQQLAIVIDGEKNEPLWKKKPSVFIGGFGTTQVKINTGWNDDMFFLMADVQDAKVFSASNDPQKDDAIRLFLDPANLSVKSPQENIFSVTVTAGGKCFYKQGKNGFWIDWHPSGITTKSRQTANGYYLELAIPWTVLRHIPETNKRIGFHAAVLETSTGIQHTYVEPLAGNVTDASYSWSPLFLTD
jgi:hypothetical protein